MSNADMIQFSRSLNAAEDLRRNQYQLIQQAKDYQETATENANLIAGIKAGEVWVDGNLYKTEIIAGKAMNRVKK